MATPASIMASKEQDMTKLKPCLFCGGCNTSVNLNGSVWDGVKWSDPISVSVIHHCQAIKGQPSRGFERIGKDLKSAVAAWNTRENAKG